MVPKPGEPVNSPFPEPIKRNELPYDITVSDEDYEDMIRTDYQDPEIEEEYKDFEYF